MTPTVEFLAAVIVTVILWFGGYQVVNGALTAGALIAFLTYAVNLANPVKRISRVYGTINKAMAAAERVFDVLDTQEDLNLMLKSFLKSVVKLNLIMLVLAIKMV